MSIWAIVPVKPFTQAKSRLKSVLTPPERAALSREFLIHTLQVLALVPEIRRVLVISRDTAALTLAREHHARTVTESGTPDLNTALRRATEAVVGLGAHALLILPTDLPLLSAEAVQGMVVEPGMEPAVVIAPDRRQTGTNALFVRPPGLIEYAFGHDSFQLHQAWAERAGARVRIFHSPAIELDVDVPEDWTLCQAQRQPALLSHL
jgi:2-phospho-L-lactate/phosphoenolpyruvate guanylyltransferase